MRTTALQDTSVLPSLQQAGPRLLRMRRLALWAIAVLVAALVPFADEPAPQVILFLPLYQMALIVCEFITAALLVNRALVGNSRQLLALAAGYGFSATMAVGHALSFPGLFAPPGLLGAGPQSTAWIYFLWHLGFAGFVMLYAVMPYERERACEPPARLGRRVASSLLAALAAGMLLLAAATAGHDAWLPIMAGEQDLPAKFIVAAVTVAAALGALLAVLHRSPPSVLDVWVSLVAAAWAAEVALAALFNDGRFSVGWYSGRIFGLLSAIAVLLMYLAQESREKRRLVELLESEARQRQLKELAAARAREAEASSRRTLEELRALAGTRLSAREEERRRLARDLHDDLGQSLAALRISLDALARHLTDPELVAQAEGMRRIHDAARDTLRRVVRALRPPLLDELGFAHGLAALIEDFCALAAVDYRFEQTPEAFDLREPFASTVFRIVQEAMGNSVRHGKAKLLDIRLSLEGDELTLGFEDDGQGFDVAAVSSGNGLTGIRERVHLLGGELRIDSKPGRGTVIRLRVSVSGSQLRHEASVHLEQS